MSDLIFRGVLAVSLLIAVTSLDVTASFSGFWVPAAYAQAAEASSSEQTTAVETLDNNQSSLKTLSVPQDSPAPLVERTMPQQLGVPQAEQVSPPAETYQRRGVVVAGKQIRLASRMDGLVSAVHVKLGDQFAKNDLLIEFDCSVERAALEEARLLHEMAKFDYVVTLRKRKENAIGNEEFELSQLKMEVALAKLNHFREQIDSCRLLAPFGGRVLTLDVQPHQSVVTLQPVIEIVEQGPLYFRLFLPWAWQQWLSVGDLVDVAIIEQHYQAELIDFSSEVDTVHQSVTARLRFPSEANLPIGISGVASFQPPN